MQIKQFFYFCVIALFSIPSLSAHAYWKDFGVYWGGNDLCNNNWELNSCLLLSQKVNANVPTKNLTCQFYFPEKCCCEGLVWVPDDPENIKISVNGNRIHMDWDSDPTVIRYELWWSESAVIHRGSDNKITFTSNSFTHKNLKYDTKYYYTIDVVGKYGRSNFWFDRKTAPDPNPQPPAQPEPNPQPPAQPEPNPNILTMQRWTTRQGGFWDAQKWVAGDFNGDGYTDFAKAFDDSGSASIDVHISNGKSFSMQRWATRQGGFWNAQQWVAGDFNGDGYTDFAKAFNDSGSASIDVHISNGNSFSMQRWATRQGGFWDAQKWVAGDFNGDGYTDFAKAFNDSGSASIDVHISNGNSFSMQRWATRQGGFWDAQKWVAGDFNGDGYTDFAKAFNDSGSASIDVHISNGKSVSMQRWATRQGGFWDAQKWVAGDFNGDGYTDFAKAFNDNGSASIDVHISSGNSVSIQRWATRQGGFWDAQQWATGDFNGNGNTDFAKSFNDSGLGSIDVHSLP